MESSSYSVPTGGNSGDNSCSTCKNCGHTMEQQSQHHSSRSSFRPASPVGSAKRFIMGYRGRMFKLAIMVIFSLMFMGIYITFFQHPPPEILLQMNQHRVGKLDFGGDFGASGFHKQRDHKVVDPVERIDSLLDETDDRDGEDNTADDADDAKTGTDELVFKHSKRELVPENDGSEFWNTFLKLHNFVPIGAVYDKCEGSKVQLGSVILQEDKEMGGIKATTFVNMTLDHEIKGGQFFIEVKYNGKSLYDNYWNLCELEEDLPVENKTFTCPIAPGKWSKVKDKHVPSYLPTGHYQSKLWALDDAENMIACGFSDFQL